MAPYHRFGADFVATAIRPTSPVNPFAGESTAAREASLGIFRTAVEARARRHRRSSGPICPNCCGLATWAIALFWVYDTSEGQRRTRKLVDGAVPLIARGLSLARIPGVNKVLDDVLSLSRSIRG